jgi:tRNAThr (cytosine32-N3)-methyltransferase
LRIKKDRLLDPATPNLYIRGDGTRVYFFNEEDFETMLGAPGLRGSVDGDEEESKGPMFVIDQLGVDRRMVRRVANWAHKVCRGGADGEQLVNRKERLKMYRIWMQVKARKVVG